MKTYTDYYNAKSFENGDNFAVKVVAVVGYGNDWAAYGGDTDMSDAEVASNGWKLNKDAAEALFRGLARRYAYRR